MIRKIRTEEQGRLIEIWESAVLATHDFLAVADFAYFKENLPTYFSFVTLWGYEQKGQLVGFIGVALNSLEMLFIDQEVRGKGIGKLLIQYGIQELGITRVEVNEQNEQAVGFYEHMGFRPVNRMEVDGQGKPYPILQMDLV